jgi:hypothetical protein
MLLLGVLIVAVVGCTTTAPAPSAHPRTAAPHETYAVPPPQPGDLARIVYTRRSPEDAASVDVPAGGTGFSIDMGCSASNPSVTISFQLSHDSTPIVSGETVCDGGQYRDTATLPANPAETVHLSFTTDFSKVSGAYLILSPADQ